MALLQLLLAAAALCWHCPVALGELKLPPRAFSFEDLPAGSGTLPSTEPTQTVEGGTECACRLRCLTEPACRGYGYSVRTSTCRLTELLPTSQRMQESREEWRWHARYGVRLLGEPCAVDGDCSTLTPAAACVKNVCSCLDVATETGAGGCAKAGRFLEVPSHQLATGLLSEMSGTTIAACSAACAGELHCVAFDFSSDGLCRKFSAGITSDAVTARQTPITDTITESRAVRSFIWKFAHADGTPPATYESTPGGKMRLLPVISPTNASSICFSDGAILFPGVNAAALASVHQFLSNRAKTTYVWIGLSDVLEEGRYVTSDNQTPTEIAWDTNQGHGHEDCGVVAVRSSLVHDAPCGWQNFEALCQYVGENLALNKFAWMSVNNDQHPASHGNDGLQGTVVRSKALTQLASLTWTVDLGQPVQVTSVLYMASSSSDLTTNRNHLTEIRVGSDRASFDEQHSARCVWLEAPFVADGHARLFRCTVPVTGRFVRLIRRQPETVLDFADLAVFGNRLMEHEPEILSAEPLIS